MKTWRGRFVAVGALALAVLLVGSGGALEPAWAQARGGGGGHGGGGGGYHGGGGGGYHGGGGGGYHGGGYHGGGHGGSWHGGSWHGGWHRSVIIGGSWWWPYGYAYPYYWPYWYPPSTVVEPVPQVYVQREPEPLLWYYCQGPNAGYYPQVQECPGGWIKVAPQPNQPSAPG